VMRERLTLLHHAHVLADNTAEVADTLQVGLCAQMFAL
jgi:hypothetical protein